MISSPQDAPAALCPHCRTVLAEHPSWPFPAAGERCPGCHLLIGPGRALQAGEEPAPIRRGSAAGVLASAARGLGGDATDAGVVRADLCRVAIALATPVDRLRMLDYDAAARGDDTLTPLADVLATFATWKDARAAAMRIDASEDEAGPPGSPLPPAVGRT